MIIGKKFTFDASHFIPEHNGKCRNLHGHTYEIEIVLEGAIRSDGMVEDFGEVKRIVNLYIINELDHHHLNDIQGLELPTAENLCMWIKDRLMGKLPIKGIKVWETRDSYAELRWS